MRCYSESLIKEIVCAVCLVVAALFQITDKTNLDAYALEKPTGKR